MNHQDALQALTRAGGWRKSTRSQGANDCVEITDQVPGWVGVRDSKLADASPVLAVTVEQWRLFRTSVRDGRIDAGQPLRVRTAPEVITFPRGPVRTVWHLRHRDTGVELHYTAGERDAFLAGLVAGEMAVSAPASGSELATLVS